MRRLALAASAALALGFQVVPAGAQPIHDRIYQPPKAPLQAEAGLALFRVRTADGLSLAGLERAPHPGKPTLLLFHGNGSAASGMAAWLKPLIDEGYGVVFAEYRGYSGNPGRPDEAGLAKDADAFYAEARMLAASGRLIVVGHSLGAGVAFELAERRRLDALVTIGAFTRLRDMAPAIVRPFMFERYDNLAAIRSVRAPVFLIHGLRDEVAPSAFAEALHAAAHEAKTPGLSFIVPDAGHNPPGATIAAILRAILVRLETPAAALPDLPPDVRVYERQ